MAPLYAAMTAILAISFLAFLLEEALRSHAREQHEQEQSEANVRLA